MERLAALRSDRPPPLESRRERPLPLDGTSSPPADVGEPSPRSPAETGDPFSMSNGLLAMGQLSFSERLRQARALDALLETFSDDEDDDADAWSFRPPEVPRATVAVAAAIADRSSNSSSPSAAAALRASAAAIAGRRAATNAAACAPAPSAGGVRRAAPPPSPAGRAAPLLLVRRAAPRRAVPPSTAPRTRHARGAGSRLRPERRRRQVAEPESSSRHSSTSVGSAHVLRQNTFTLAIGTTLSLGGGGGGGGGT